MLDKKIVYDFIGEIYALKSFESKKRDFENDVSDCRLRSGPQPKRGD